MKKLIVTILVITLLGLLLFDIYELSFQKHSNCITEEINQKQKDVTIFQNQILSYIYENELLNIADCKIYKGKTPVKLVDIITNEPVLVLRFSEFNCMACVDLLTNQIKKSFLDYLTNTKIILIYDSETMRLPQNIFEKPVFLTPKKNLLGLPMENFNTPFMFILDKDMKAKQFFVPEKDMPDLTNRYLTIIKSRYFKKS
jgi:hypothetical protein